MDLPSCKKLIPKSASDWVIRIGLLIYALSRVPGYFLPPSDSLNLTWTSWLVKHIGDAGLLLAIAVMVSSGIRSLRKDGFSMKRVVNPIIGISISLACLIVSFYGHRTFSRMEEVFHLDDKFDARLANIMRKEELSLSERSKWGKLHAKNRYLVSGEKINYFTLNGTTIRYQPSREDIEYRDERLRGKRAIVRTKFAMQRGSFAWGAVLLLGMGVFSPIRRN